MLETEHATRGAPRAFVRYDDLLADWRPEVAPRRRRARRCRCSRTSTAPRRRRSTRSSTRRCTATARRWDDLDVPARVRDLAERGLATLQPLADRRRRGRAGARSTPTRDALPRRSTREAEAIAQSSITAAKRAGAARKPAAARRRAPPRCACASRAACPAPYRRAVCARRALAAPLLGSPPCRASASSSRSTTSRSYLERVPGLARRRRRSSDLEVVMVDDGSTDGSAAIAAALRRPRPPLPARQPAQRRPERGAQHRHRRRRGRVPRVPRQRRRAAAERLRAAASARSSETGSDFATGNVLPAHQRRRPSQAPFLAQAFARDAAARRTSRKYRPLLADRTAWNKLWRRSFWDEHGLRFPEGRIHEDIPVMLPAHFAARRRSTSSPSPSTCSGSARAATLLDHPAAAEPQRAARPPRRRRGGQRPPRAARARARAKRWYDESVVADDLRYYLNVARRAPTRSTARCSWTASTRSSTARPRSVFDALPAIERLKWHLVRRRLMPELLEVLRFQREDLRDTPPVRIARPLVRRLPVPRPTARLEDPAARSTGSTRSSSCRRRSSTRCAGTAAAAVAGCALHQRHRRAERAAQQRRASSLLQAGPAAARAAAARRPCGCATDGRPPAGRDRERAGRRCRDLEWSGFEATLDPAGCAVRALARGHVGALRDGARRRRQRRRGRASGSTRAADPRRRAAGRRRTRWRAPCRPRPTASSSSVRTRWAARGRRWRSRGDGGGSSWPASCADAPHDGKLEAKRRADAVARRRAAARLERSERFSARISLDELGRRRADARRRRSAPTATRACVWELAVALGGGRRHRLLGARPAAGGIERRRRDARSRSRARGRATRRSSSARRARWSPTRRWDGDGALELAGDARARRPAPRARAAPPRRRRAARLRRCAGDGGRFSAALTPARSPRWPGTLPLREGTWELSCARRAGPTAPVMVAHALVRRRCRSSAPSRHKPFAFAHDGQDGGARSSSSATSTTTSAARSTSGACARPPTPPPAPRPLRDAVVYASFGGRQYSDSPRAIHEELVRRGAPLEHLWVVRDGALRGPASGAGVLREGSREYYEALARARYVVDQRPLPGLVPARRTDQVVPADAGTARRSSGSGFDVAEQRGRRARRFERAGTSRSRTGSTCSPRTASRRRSCAARYAVEGELLETGYPAQRRARRRRARDAARGACGAALGLPDGARVVLYAPTYRDHVGGPPRPLPAGPARSTSSGCATPPDPTRSCSSASTTTSSTPVARRPRDGFVRDVSTYPGRHRAAARRRRADHRLLVDDVRLRQHRAADAVLHLRPRRVRGDDPRLLPRPSRRPPRRRCCAPTDELAEALADPAAACAPFAGRRDAFVAGFCPLDDGGASARVADLVFS